MKFIFLLLPFFLFGQKKLSVDSSDIYLIGNLNDLKEEISSNCLGWGSFSKYKYVLFPNLVFIGTKTCENKNYKNEVTSTVLFYQFAYGDKTYFLNSKDVDFKVAYVVFGETEGDGKAMSVEEAMAYYNMFSESEKKDFKKRAILTGKVMKQIEDEQEASDVLDELESKEKYGVVLKDWYPTEDYYTTGVYFNIVNPSKKVIKYISFYVKGFNAVGDPVRASDGDYVRKLKGIGPVERYSEGSWSFDDVWLTDVVSTARITKIHIIYMDGTEKTVPYDKEMNLSKTGLHFYSRQF